MMKITVHGHRPPCLNSAGAAAQPRSAASDNPDSARSNGSLETVQKVNLGFIKLKIHRPNVPEMALRAQLQKVQDKAGPNPSKSGLPEVRLNCEVQVSPSADAPSWQKEVVCCRHLALAFAQHGNKKSELTSVFTKLGIWSKFDGRLSAADDEFNRVVREAPEGCKHVVSSDQFGGYLTALAKTLQHVPDGPDTPKEANCLLLTANHAMALHLQRKSKAGVNYLAVKVYDPNDTAAYKRVTRLTPESLGSLDFKAMMIRPELQTEYAGDHAEPLSMVAVCLDHRLQPTVDRRKAVPSATNMQVALRCGANDAVHAMLESAAASQSHEELLHLLHATSPVVSRPGLYLAFEDDHAETVRLFSQSVLKIQNLDDAEKVSVLQAKNANGVPGLFFALDLNLAKTVRAFVRAVTESSLSQGQKVGLLTARCPDNADLPQSCRGRSARAAGRERGRTDAVEAFCGAVEDAFLSSNLTEAAKAKLLSA